jgi:Mn2+/Fe2+ NRAMP family transporter
MAFVRGHAYNRHWDFQNKIWENTSLYSLLPLFLLMTLLWCWAISSLPPLLLDVHEEMGEQDLRTFAVVKLARGTSIRFLGSVSVRPLKAVRKKFTLPRGHSWSFTLIVCFVYFALIIQALTKPKGEPMIQFVAMGWFHLVFVLVLMNIHEICLKLKSRFRIIHKFPTTHNHNEA